MRLLLIAYYYPPMKSGGTLRPRQMVKYLSRLGHTVTVLTHTYRKSEEWDLQETEVVRIYDGSHNRNRRGFRRWQWLGRRLYVEFLNRLGTPRSIYSWWQERAWRRRRKIMETVKPDLILATYPPVETLQLAVSLSESFAVPFVADFRDGLLFEPIEEKRLSRYRCIGEHYRGVEESAVQQASAVITAADPITDYCRRRYRRSEVYTVPTGFDPEDFALQAGYPAPPLDASKFHVVYTGRFQLSDRGVSAVHFFEAVRQLLLEFPALSHRFRIHLLGDYAPGELRSLRDLGRRGIVAAHGLLDRPSCLAYQRRADLLLIITSLGRSSVTTTKIFEYLHARRPILALTHRTVAADMVRETKSGWIVHPRHTGEIKDTLYRLLTDSDFYLTIKPSRQRIGNYSAEAIMRRLDRVLRKRL